MVVVQRYIHCKYLLGCVVKHDVLVEFLDETAHRHLDILGYTLPNLVLLVNWKASIPNFSAYNFIKSIYSSLNLNAIAAQTNLQVLVAFSVSIPVIIDEKSEFTRYKLLLESSQPSMLK